MNRDDLHGYQEEAVQWMVEHGEGMVWLGLGDGKTIVALTAIAEIGQTALVVGTKNIVELTWPEEIQKWDHTKWFSYAACCGPKKKREAAVESNPDILGVSYENLRWLYENYPRLNRPILILDESSKLKNTGTKRFRSHVRKVPCFDYRFGLTATPASESYIGLFGQAASLLTDRPLGRNVTAFRERYTTQLFRGMYTEYAITEHNKREIEAALAPYIFVVDDSERPEKPEPRFIDHYVGWQEPAVEEQYREMERHLVAELESGTTVLAASKGVAFNKCRQIASGFVYDREQRAHALDLAKIDLIEEEYEALGGEPALIFYQFAWERDVLMERLEGAECELSPDVFDRWNNGDIRALVLHPASAGHGLNLMGPCRHLFWASLPWSLEHYLQSNGRIDRQGQKRQPIIKRFFREGTIEADVMERLDGKFDSMEQLIERMRARA